MEEKIKIDVEKSKMVDIGYEILEILQQNDLSTKQSIIILDNLKKSIEDSTQT